MEEELKLRRVKGEELRKELDRVYGEAFGIVEARFRELESKEVELKGQSFELEERGKKVEEAEAQLVDLERKSDGFRLEVEARKKELNLIRNQVEVSVEESGDEEVRLARLRILVIDCEVEKILKESQLSEVVEALRNTHVELGLKGEELEEMEYALERCRDDVSVEMESLSRAQTQRRQLDEEVERKTKYLTLVQDKLAECEKLFECKREHLGEMEADLERHHVKLSADKELWERTQTQNRELEEETERKRKNLTMVLDKIAGCGTQLKSVEEQLDSQQKLLEKRSSELVAKEEELKVLSREIVFEKKTLLRAQDFNKKLAEKQDLAVKKLDSTRSHLEICISEHESARKELNAVKDRYKESIQDLDIKVEELNFVESILSERNKQVEEGEKKIQYLSSSSEELNRQLKLKEKEVCSISNTIREYSCELEDKRKQRDQVQSSLTDLIAEQKSEESQLNSVKEKIQDTLKDFQSKEEEQARLKASLMEHEQELEVKEKELSDREARIDKKAQKLKSTEQKLAKSSKKAEQAKLSLLEREQGLELKEKELGVREENFNKKAQQLKSTEEKLAKSSKKTEARLKASLMEREQGLALKEKKLGVREERIKKKAQQLKSTEQTLAKSSKKTELKAKRQGNTVHQVDLVRDANVCDEKTLQLLIRGHLKKRDQLHLDILSSVKRSSDPAKLVLDTINGLYAAHQRTAIKNPDPDSLQRSSICLLECLMDISAKPTTEVQEEAITFATEWKNTSLVEAENPVEVLEFLHFLAAFSLAYTFDADKDQTLFDLDFLHKYGSSLCKALGVSALAPVNNVLLLEDKPEEQPTEAPVINSTDPCSSDVQQNIASSHLPDEDSLRDIEDSTYFSLNEVSTALPVFKDPGRFVLNAVESALTDASDRGELSLGGPILMNLVPLLEELARVVRSTDPRLQSDATQVVRLWVRMMRASVEKSQLEAWAFLQFIVAFGLVTQTKPDESLQIASHVAHFRHAPKLFQSLGLTDAIPGFVTKLFDKGLTFPAIRFMFYFKVKNSFNPMEFLKEQINNLRRSAKEKRRYESQAEANRDAAIMKNIMELTEDFELEIDIPVELIIKFMVPRDIQNLPAQSTHMQTSHTVFQSSGIATHGSNPSFGGSTAFQGQSSHQTGFKRPRVEDAEGPRPVIRPCFNPPSGFGEF